MAETKPKTLDEVELPETKPYRVAMLGATYMKAEAVYGPTGPMLSFMHELGKRGDVIELDEAQAHRLLELGAVVEADDPRGYGEMDENELAALAKARGVDVRSSSLDPAQPLRLDYVNALQSYDAGVTSLLPAQEGELAQPSPVPTPEQNRGPNGEPITPDEDVPEKVRNAPEATEANVNALGEYLKDAKPNADETIAIAGGTPDGARAVLDAENLVTGHDPRAGVERALLKIIDEEEAGGQ